MRVLLLCVVVCSATGFSGVAAKSATLPTEFKTCKRGDDACMMVACNEAIKIVAAKGIPNLNIKPIEPYFKDVMNINQGSIKLVLSNQKMHGMGMTEISEVKTKMGDKKQVLDLQFYIPWFSAQGDYKMGGRVLVLPIRGHGKSNCTYTDMRGHIVVNSHTESRDGEDYLRIDNYDITFNTTRLYIDFENLMDGNKLLADNMAQVLNDNWKVLLDEVKPSIVAIIGDVVLDVLGAVYSQVSYATLFPKQ